MQHPLVPSRTWRRAWHGLAALIACAALLHPPRNVKADEPAAAPKLAGIWKLNEKESDSFEKKMQERMGSREGGEGGRGEGGGGGGWRGGGGGMGGGRRGGGGGGWGGGGGGRHGGGGGQEAGGAEGDAPRRNPDMAELAHPAATLLIEQTDSTFILSDQGQTIQTLALVPKVTLPGTAVAATPARGDSARAEAAAVSATPTAAAGTTPATAGSAPPPGGPPPSGSAPPRAATPGQRLSDGTRYQAWWDRTRLMAARVNARGGRMSETFELGKDGKSLVIKTSVETRPDAAPIELKRVYDRYEGD